MSQTGVRPLRGRDAIGGPSAPDDIERHRDSTDAVMRHVDESDIQTGPIVVTLGDLVATTWARRCVVFSRDATGPPAGPLEPTSLRSVTRRTRGLRLLARGRVSIEILHTLEHAIRLVAPSVLPVGLADLEGETDLDDRVAYVYDERPGTEVCDRLARRLPEIMSESERRLAACSCEDGCGRCVYISGCTLHNELLSRRATLQCLSPNQDATESQVPFSRPLVLSSTGPQTNDLRGRGLSCRVCGKTFRTEGGMLWHQDHFKH